MKIDKLKIKKILFITLSNIGDAVLTLPVLAVLRREFPEAQITVMAGSNVKEIFETHPSVSRIIVYNKRISLFQKIAFAMRLRGMRFDLVVDLKNSFFPIIAGSRYRAPVLRGRRVRLHKKEAHLKALSALGILTDEAPFDMFFNPEDIARVDSLLKEHNLSKEDTLVAISAGSKSHTKRWPATGFVRLCDRLTKELGAKIILIGDIADKPVNDEIKGVGLNDVYDLTQKTNLRELAYLLSLCRLLVTNDSAPLHVASAVNTPTVAIFGPTDSVKYGPLALHSAVMRKAFRCSPCERALCRFDLECMKQVQPDAVFKACYGILKHEPDVEKNRFNRILLTRTDRLGDLILTTPAIKAVRNAFPDAHIAVIVTPYTEVAVRGNPYINEVIVYDKAKAHRSIFSNIRFAKDLERRNFDLAVVFDPTNRMHILTWLARIPRRVGYDEKSGILLTDRVKDVKREGKKHERDYILDLLKVIGIESGEKELHFPVTDSAVQFVEELLEANGISKGDKIVSMHPGASCPSKIWPAQRFAKLSDKLITKYGVKVIVVGGGDPRSAACADRVRKFMTEKALFLAGSLSITQLGALLKRSALFISNDSGPVHVAAAVKTPVIALFGRNQPGLGPTRWGPLGPKDIVIHKDVGCKGICLAHNCNRSFDCLSAISVEEVLKAVEAIGIL